MKYYQNELNHRKSWSKGSLVKYIMKYTTIFFIVFLATNKSNGNNISYSDLVKIDEIFYEKESSKPFSGNIVGLFEGKFIEGKKFGEFVKFYNDGKLLSRVNYFDNKLNGVWLEYYRNGNLLSKKIFKNNLLNGIYIDYYSFGQILSKRFYINNKLEGKYEEFYKNGQLHIIKNYENNILEGEFISYHEYEFNPTIQIKVKYI